jgi:alpha-galactosidase
MLNLGIDAAREHIRDIMLDILRDTGATWIKWDFNEDLWRGGWAPDTPDDLERIDPLYAHCQGLYRLQDELHAALPDLIIEMCASGGGRFDAETLRRGHTQWMSDESRPLRNLSIHFGLQLAHPPELCNDWLIRWPAAALRYPPDEPVDNRGDFLFRLRIAMLGTLGISAKVEEWTAEEIATARAEVDWYKSVARPLINDGRQFILTPQPGLDGTGGWAAMAHVARDASRAVAYVFRLDAEEGSFVLRLPGLDRAATYRLDAPGQSPRDLSGAALAVGVTLPMPDTYTSERLTAIRVENG